MLQIDDSRLAPADDPFDCGPIFDLSFAEHTGPDNLKEDADDLNYNLLPNRRFSAPVNTEKMKVEFENRRDQMIFSRKFQLMERHMKSDKFPLKILRKAFSKEILEYYNDQLS